MTTTDLHSLPPKGVIDNTYSDARSCRTELTFGLKTRANNFADVIAVHYEKRGKLSLLDLGAAEGKTSLELDKYFPGSSLRGVEFSEGLNVSSKELSSNMCLVKEDVCDLYLGILENSFDIVISLECLEHLEDTLAANSESN